MSLEVLLCVSSARRENAERERERERVSYHGDFKVVDLLRENP
jgi:hypothetical protein